MEIRLSVALCDWIKPRFGGEKLCPALMLGHGLGMEASRNGASTPSGDQFKQKKRETKLPQTIHQRNEITYSVASLNQKSNQAIATFLRLPTRMSDQNSRIQILDGLPRDSCRGR